VNRQIRQLAVALMGLYVVLFGALNYWQVGEEEELAAEPTNTRALIRQFDSPRGPIVTADGVVVARSVQAPGDSDVRYVRTYPTDDLFAHVTGYYTFGLGATQIEKAYSDVLSGDTFTQQVRAIDDLFASTNDTSGSVVLTMRNDAQEAAKFALGGREGSIVVLDATTGAVQAMWSYPSFDPNIVADADYDAAYDYLTQLQADPTDPLLANAYQQRYMPGSTFKVLTTGIAFDDGVTTLDRVFPEAREWVPPQTDDPIQNYGGSTCGGDMTTVFARSCNIPFAQMSIELGPERFQEGMARWGIGETVPIDLPGATSSTIGDFTDIDDNLPLLAIRGFGQNDTQMVPLHMAMVAAAVANDGEMMRPFVVDATLDHTGRVLSRTQADVWKRPISLRTAQTMQDLMVAVAENGTASCCIALEGGVPVAAKTGTAQLNGPGEPERSHAWIVAYAPADAPRYAVAVMIKGTNAEISASTGGRLAGPIARDMLNFMLRTETPAGAPAEAPVEAPVEVPAPEPTTVPPAGAP
jgi:penicillin-binding protein A